MNEMEGIGIALRLNGPERGLNDAARNLRAVDRAWTFAVSVEAYQRGYQDTWARQTQYAPRPKGLRINKDSPTIVELWDAIDVPAIVAAGFSAFVYIVNNIEKIVTVPERIAIARASARIERGELEAYLDELESSDEPILVEPPEPPPIAIPGEPTETVSLVELDRELEILRARHKLSWISRLEDLRSQLDADLSALEERARSVQRELERAEREVVREYGVRPWRARRRRAL